jgi:hypothetical protein
VLLIKVVAEAVACAGERPTGLAAGALEVFTVDPPATTYKQPTTTL